MAEIISLGGVAKVAASLMSPHQHNWKAAANQAAIADRHEVMGLCQHSLRPAARRRTLPLRIRQRRMIAEQNRKRHVTPVGTAAFGV